MSFATLMRAPFVLVLRLVEHVITTCYATAGSYAWGVARWLASQPFLRSYAMISRVYWFFVLCEVLFAILAYFSAKHGVSYALSLVYASRSVSLKRFLRAPTSVLENIYDFEPIDILSALLASLDISFLAFWAITGHLIYQATHYRKHTLKFWRSLNDFAPVQEALPPCTIHRDKDKFYLMTGEDTTLGTSPIFGTMVDCEFEMKYMKIQGVWKHTPVMTRGKFQIDGSSQPQVDSTVNPESFVPSSPAERGKPSPNAFYFWIQEGEQWKVHSSNCLWKASHNCGHAVTHLRHAFKELRKLTVNQIQISGPDMIRVPYLSVSKTGKHPCDAWSTTCLKEFDGDDDEPYVPDVSDLFVSSVDINFSLLSVKMDRFEPETSFGAYGHLYCISNDIKSMEGITRGRIEEDSNLATLAGICRHSLSAGPGTSGGDIRTDGSNKVMGLHIAGHRFVAGRDYPNYGIPGMVVAQAMRKYCGDSPLPYYSQAFELTFEKVLEEVAKLEEVELITGNNICEAINMKPSTKSVTYLSDLLGDPIRSEARIDPNVWRSAVRKLRRSGKSDKHIKALLYRKVSGRVSEYDPDATPEDEEMWKQVEEDIRDQIYGDSALSPLDECPEEFEDCVDEVLPHSALALQSTGYDRNAKLGAQQDIDNMWDFDSRSKRKIPPGLRPVLRPGNSVTPESAAAAKSKDIRSNPVPPVVDVTFEMPPLRHYSDDVSGCVPSKPLHREMLHQWDMAWDIFLENYTQWTLLEALDFIQNSFPVIKGHTKESKHFRLVAPEARVDENILSGKEEDGLLALGKCPYNTRNKTKPYDEQSVYGNSDLMTKLRKYNLVDKDGKLIGNWPAEGPAAEKESLIGQLRQKLARKRGYDPLHLEERVKGLPAGRWDWNVPFKQYLQDILKAMDPAKAAGWSTLMGVKTKGDWASEKRCLESGLYNVVLLLKSDHDFMASMSPSELFFNGYIVPEEDSIKTEINKMNKILEKRWRLIWRTSARFEFVTRFFHDVQNKTEISLFQAGFTHSEKFPYFGSSPGMGHDDVGISRTVDSIKRMFEGRKEGGNNGVGLDAKGWDFGVTRELWACDGWRRGYLAGEMGAPSCFILGCLNLAMALSAHVVRIGSVVYAVQIFGIMGSGSSSTSASNSFMREHIHSEAFWILDRLVALALTMGDDLIGRDKITDAHKQIWTELGMRMVDDTKFIPVGAPVPFTSFLYDLEAETAEYDNIEKMMLRLVLSEVNKNYKLTREQACGILFAVRHTPDARAQVEEYVRTELPEFVGLNWELVTFDPVTVF